MSCLCERITTKPSFDDQVTPVVFCPNLRSVGTPQTTTGEPNIKYWHFVSCGQMSTKLQIILNLETLEKYPQPSFLYSNENNLV